MKQSAANPPKHELQRMCSTQGKRSAVSASAAVKGAERIALREDWSYPDEACFYDLFDLQDGGLVAA